MSPEDEKSVPLRMESPPSPAEPVTALAALKNIRVARGLSLEDVSARLKYRPRVIDALESERWQELPKGVGLKTLTKNYARLLGVDYSALEPALRDHLRGAQTGIGNHTSTRAIGETMEEVPASGSLGWLVLVVVAILVLVGIAVWQGLVPDSLLPNWLRG